MTTLACLRSPQLIAVVGGALLTIATIGCQEDAEPPTAAGLEPSTAVAEANALAFRQLSAGDDHTCGTTTGNAAYCWGGGALGAGGGTSFSTSPVPVVGGHAFQLLSAGRFHTCGVTTNGVAFCWGGNGGALGDGTDIDRPRPRQVVGGLTFRQISAGSLHTCGVTTGDAAYCWGHNQAGELGDGTSDQSLVPVPVAGGLAFRQVTGGDQVTCGVTTDDVVYCWGMNMVGQLGVGSDVGPETCFTGDSFDACSRSPVRVRGGQHFSTVSAGSEHACAVTLEDVAFCWGDNVFGELGRGTITGPDLCLGSVPCSTRPRRVVGGLAFASVDGGASHTCGVTTDGTGYCWGANGAGELGTGSKSGPETCLFDLPCSSEPLAVFGGHEFRSVTTGPGSSCGLTPNDVAFCWGGNVGDGTTQNRPRPRRVVGPS